MTLFRHKILITAMLAATWVAALGYGMRVLLAYEITPGSTGPVATRWPSVSIVPRQSNQPTLVMVAHPRCPCTRASIAELAQIMAHALGRAHAYVLFVKLPGADADWDDTDLRRSAAAIPGVTVITDENGAEAARLGAQTSGHTVVFDREGKVLFNGGITASRGHAGSNPGENAVLAALQQQIPALRQTPVFGCAVAKLHPDPKGKP